MEFNNTPNQPILVDGKEVWISRSVTVLPVLMFVLRGETYLPLGKRGPGLPNEVGKWGLPGGYLDYDETVSGAVVREIWEELGLNVPALREQFTFEGDLEQPYFVASQPLRLQNVTLRYALRFVLPDDAELPTLNPQVGPEEVEETRWFTLQESLNHQLAFHHEQVIQECLDRCFSTL